MTFKAAIAGCGGIFPMHADALKRTEISIEAVCDVKPERAEQRAEQYGAKAFTDINAMLDAGGFDTLHICLPHYLHAPVTIEALRRGYNVLCEKPMATTVADAEKMLAVEKESKGVLGIIFQNRYNPGSQLVKRVYESGVLGKPLNGFLRVTWQRGKSYYVDSGWRGRWATEGGGILINQAIHTVDLAVYLMGLPESADAIAANRAHPYNEVEDVAEGILRYPGGVGISFYVNTFHPYDAPVQFELVCENGTISVTGDEATVTYSDGRVETAGRDISAQAVLGMKDYWGVSHITQIKDFYRALEAGERPTIDGNEGIKAVKVLEMIYKSSKGKGMLFNEDI